MLRQQIVLLRDLRAVNRRECIWRVIRSAGKLTQIYFRSSAVTHNGCSRRLLSVFTSVSVLKNSCENHVYLEICRRLPDVQYVAFGKSSFPWICKTMYTYIICIFSSQTAVQSLIIPPLCIVLGTALSAGLCALPGCQDCQLGCCWRTEQFQLHWTTVLIQYRQL